MPKVYQMLCTIWYHGGMLLLVKLQAYFNKTNTPPWGFFTFFKLYKWYHFNLKGQNVFIQIS